MRLKRFLILAPIILMIVLLQSYFWVPTYESQTSGNPERVLKFIEASIGDAKILNPILNADTASSRITGLVFEGLLDYDEALNLRGRLATNWSISETAYLLVNTNKRFPDQTPVTGIELESRIKKSIAQGSLATLKNQITHVERIPPEDRIEKISLPGEEGKPLIVTVHIQTPERIKISLNMVNQDLLSHLKPIIGKHYHQDLPYENWIEVKPSDKRGLVDKTFPDLLPILEHNPVLLFHLRENVHFHDGHPFNAEDVRFTYEAIMNPKNLSPRTSDFEPIKQIEVLDPFTVRIVYKRLFSPAINAWTMGILPEHLLNEATLAREMDTRNLSQTARESFGMRDSVFNRNPVGVGPFQFVEWQSDELIHLTRNESYWGGTPQYKDFYYRIIPDYLTQEVEFRAGAIDRYSPLPHQAARYKKEEAYQSFSSLNFGFSYIGYNNRKVLFADKEIRKALGMAINIDEILKYVLYGEGEQTTGPYPKNTLWYDHNVQPNAYDPDESIRLFEKMGWEKNKEGWLEKDGKIFEFNLITNNGNPIRKAIMTIAQNSWLKIGVKCNTQLFEWAVFLKDFINTGDFDAIILGWSMGVDPDLYQIWHSSQSGPAQLNFVGYSNPEADKLILRIRKEYDEKTQKGLAHQLHQIIAEEQPYTFLYASLGTLVLDKKIVMMEKDGKYSKIKPTKTGDVFFYFNQWKKLEFSPSF